MSEERLQNILKLIEGRQNISVKELETQLYVSSATIRRDLAELVRRGLIVRSHGKAMAVTRMAHAVACGQPDLSGDPIGTAAAALIKPHSVVFIGAGHCSLSLAKAASQIQDLTVITDSIAAADILCGHTAHLYCTGGQTVAGRDSLSGSQAAELAGLFYYNIAFFSCDSLTESGSIAFNELERMPVLRAAARQAEKRVLLFSGEQMKVEPGLGLLRLKDMDYIVTDVPGHFGSAFHGAVIGTGG